jgi:putative NIF3 family GTP cyclohydrolase 1 type 2
VLLTGELRYHVALEALASGLSVIEAGHDVTEWPHVPVLAAALRSHPALAGRVVADEPRSSWWTT